MRARLPSSPGRYAASGTCFNLEESQPAALILMVLVGIHFLCTGVPSDGK